VTGVSAPYALRTPRLILRCPRPETALLLRAAVVASLPELRQWMDWAIHEPAELPTLEERLTRFRDDFLGGRDWPYGIFDPADGSVLGGAGLHPRRGPGALEIGYWIRSDVTGRGLGTEAAAALTRVAVEVHGVQRVEIRCDPNNTRSAAIPRRLGYRHETTLPHDTLTPDGCPRDTMVWALAADDYPSSPAASVALEGYDVEGRRVL
jgi:RimJ/RimL family protein N-acetyltransferase